VTALQLRVAEFSEKTFGIRYARCSCRGHQRRFHGYKSTTQSEDGFHVSLLSDADAAVIRRYDLLHRGAGPKGIDIARPAEFLIDSHGIIRWVI
jgi:peroxiredoxin